MHQYRHILVRMRLGETDRQIARAGLMGRRKAAAVRQRAQQQGWLTTVPEAQHVSLGQLSSGVSTAQ